MNFKNYLLTVAYANQNVLETSYNQLRDTMASNPIPVMMFDNFYPMNKLGFGADLAVRHKFQYYTHGINIGLYPAIDYLLSKIPDHCEKVICYDGDNYPKKDNWHLALLKVLDDPGVVHSTLVNQVILDEMSERGCVYEKIQGENCLTATTAMTNTTCAFKVSFLREIGGVLGGKKYYGGNEITMWPYYKGRKWVFLADYWEDKGKMMGLHDWQYQQYKMLYAHGGLNMTFEQYIKTNPERIYDIKKHIWG